MIAAPADPFEDQRLSRCARLALGLAFRAAPWVLAGHLAVTLISAGLPVVVTWVVKNILDRLANGSGVQDITGPAGLLAVASAVAALAPQVLGYLQARMTRATSLLAQERLHIAVDTFTGLSRFENPEFLDRLRLAQQAGGITPFQVVQTVAGMTRSGVLLIGFIGSLAVLNLYLAAIVALSGLPVLWAEIALSRQRARTYWAISPTERREIFYSTLLSSVEAAKEVRLYGIGGFLRERMLTERRTADSHRELLERKELRVQSVLQITSAVLTGVALVWAVRAAARQDMTVGDVSMLLAAIPAVQGGIGGLARELGQAHHSLVMFHHYVSVIGLGPDIPAPQHPQAAHPLRNAIEFEDVWFRYGDGLPWVLRGVSLRIEAGTAIALVGVNGSGKSTLVKLLCRFYDPTRGRILWDSTDLRDIPPDDLRARIAATFQEPMRYDLSAKENIGIGELSALHAPDRYEEAARFAGVHEDITRLPRGYETLLSRSFWDDDDDGVVLSGGQWQRMGIARLCLRADADLLVLDEPTSSLDPDAEYEIHTRLRAHRAGRTSMLISHRLGAIRDADTIAVLEDGRITERGDHRQLIAQQGTYHRLFTRQSRNYREEVPPVPDKTDPYGDEAALSGGGLGA